MFKTQNSFRKPLKLVQIQTKTFLKKTFLLKLENINVNVYNFNPLHGCHMFKGVFYSLKKKNIITFPLQILICTQTSTSVFLFTFEYKEMKRET